MAGFCVAMALRTICVYLSLDVARGHCRDCRASYLFTKLDGLPRTSDLRRYRKLIQDCTRREFQDWKVEWYDCPVSQSDGWNLLLAGCQAAPA